MLAPLQRNPRKSHGVKVHIGYEGLSGTLGLDQSVGRKPQQAVTVLVKEITAIHVSVLGL